MTIEIYLLNVLATVGSLHQELNSGMTNSSSAHQAESVSHLISIHENNWRGEDKLVAPEFSSR